MRVVGGSKRGTQLIGFERDEVRPTLDRVKESMFNIIQFEACKTAVDLFAGTGQLVIEAISRGSEHVVFTAAKLAEVVCEDDPFAAEALLKQTRDQYDFGGLNDFLYLYFKPLAEGRHYSFTLDKKLEAMLKRIDQHPEDAEREKRRSSAAAKRRKMIPLPLQILRFFATWPIYLVQFVFESFRFAVINVQKLAWIIGVFLSLTFSQLITGHSLFANLWSALTQFPDEVARQLQSLVGSMDYNNFVAVLGGLAFIVELAVSFVLVPVLCTMFLFYLARDLDQSIDLMGYHKTFQHIQQTIEKKLLQAYKKLGKKLYGKMIWPILANVLTVAALVGIVVLIVCLFRFLGAEAVLAAMI